jgi:hypothetical protein
MRILVSWFAMIRFQATSSKAKGDRIQKRQRRVEGFEESKTTADGTWPMSNPFEQAKSTLTNTRNLDESKEGIEGTIHRRISSSKNFHHKVDRQVYDMSRYSEDIESSYQALIQSLPDSSSQLP